MPVIFLPNESKNEEDDDCADSNDTQMSAFGFMSFAMALVNVVVNNANNVNNNNNNNNNNDNNNNNNIGNINIANSNNDVNNMNMVTAGRRRRLYRNVSNEQENSVLLNYSWGNYSVLDKMTPHNRSLLEEYGSLISDQKWKTNLIPPVQTVSIGYIKHNHTDPYNATKEKQPKPFYHSQEWLTATFSNILLQTFTKSKLLQKAKYITSIILKSIDNISSNSYFPTFSWAQFWTYINSIIGTRR